MEPTLEDFLALLPASPNPKKPLDTWGLTAQAIWEEDLLPEEEKRKLLRNLARQYLESMPPGRRTSIPTATLAIFGLAESAGPSR